MSGIFSFQDRDIVAASEAMRRVASSAYAQKGKSVQIPSDVVKDFCGDLSAKTADEILAIRRHERAISPKTLAFSFS
jgi:hypothetical protein